ncbi:hypothetical protein RMCBS344292_17145 [Rhizopus microsporus]|nr:hypothetical protein RMCBS344292_17145 [Rhizopus microsporus]
MSRVFAPANWVVFFTAIGHVISVVVPLLQYMPIRIPCIRHIVFIKRRRAYANSSTENFDISRLAPRPTSSMSIPLELTMESLERALADPDLMHQLQDLAIRDFSSENLLFYERYLNLVDRLKTEWSIPSVSYRFDKSSLVENDYGGILHRHIPDKLLPDFIDFYEQFIRVNAPFQFSSMHIHNTTTTTTTTTDVSKRDSTELDTMLNLSNDQESQHLVKSLNATPTVGLIVHAAADGIALGASVSDPQLSMVVFFAIMLHKAPSAFALTTVLLNQGLSRARVRKHLLMFSLSAPLGAIVTYFSLQFVYTLHNLNYWTGLLLLFSGGTFLYVAMHAIQESDDEQQKQKRVSCILLGMVIPFILNLNHSH